MSAYHRWGKRSLDLLMLLAASPFVLPVVIFVALAVWLQSGNSVFFRQVRPGYKAKPFTLVKFRTMRDTQGPEGNLLSDEKRLTSLGRLLRRFSLDELPQLWNVLKGEMSFVGPRPLLMEYLTLYTSAEARRHDVRPGITGWAQINGRNSLSWKARFGLDLWYVDNCSLAVDARILMRTISQVIKRKNISYDGHATMPVLTRDRQAEP